MPQARPALSPLVFAGAVFSAQTAQAPLMSPYSPSSLANNLLLWNQVVDSTSLPHTAYASPVSNDVLPMLN